MTNAQMRIWDLAVKARLVVPGVDAPQVTIEKLMTFAESLLSGGADELQKMTAERDEWRDRAKTYQRIEDKKEVWYWQGDGFDFSESIACPVIIQPHKLREILKARADSGTPAEATPASHSLAADPIFAEYVMGCAKIGKMLQGPERHLLNQIAKAFLDDAGAAPPAASTTTSAQLLTVCTKHGKEPCDICYPPAASPQYFRTEFCPDCEGLDCQKCDGNGWVWAPVLS